MIRKYRYEITVSKPSLNPNVPQPPTYTMSVVYPSTTIELEYEETQHDDYEAAMTGQGWMYIGADLPARADKMVRQRVTASLSANGAPLNLTVGGAWTTLVSKTLTTRGGSELDIQASLISDLTAAAQFRVAVTNGSTSATADLFDPAALPVQVGAVSNYSGSYPVPAVAQGAPDVVYTIAIQVRASILAGVITPKRGSSLIVVEFASAPA